MGTLQEGSFSHTGPDDKVHTLAIFTMKDEAACKNVEYPPSVPRHRS
jgi:hypothetical protein